MARRYRPAVMRRSVAAREGRTARMPPYNATRDAAAPAGVGWRPRAVCPGLRAEERNAVMFKSLSTSLIWRGILAVAVGIIALAWPGVTVYALVILFAIYAFIAAGLQAVRAFSSRTAGAVTLALLFGLFNLIYGGWQLATGIELRRTDKALHPVSKDQHAHPTAA